MRGADGNATDGQRYARAEHEARVPFKVRAHGLDVARAQLRREERVQHRCHRSRHEREQVKELVRSRVQACLSVAAVVRHNDHVNFVVDDAEAHEHAERQRGAHDFCCPAPPQAHEVFPQVAARHVALDGARVHDGVHERVEHLHHGDEHDPAVQEHCRENHDDVDDGVAEVHLRDDVHVLVRGDDRGERNVKRVPAHADATHDDGRAHERVVACGVRNGHEHGEHEHGEVHLHREERAHELARFLWLFAGALDDQRLKPERHDDAEQRHVRQRELVLASCVRAQVAEQRGVREEHEHAGNDL